MKIYTPKRLAFFCFTLVILIVGVNSNYAQNSTDKTSSITKNSAKTTLSKIIRTKRLNSPFVVITPQELAQISGDEKQNLFGIGDPCNTATGVFIGQSIGNALNDTDCQLDDGSYADFYSFNGT